MNLKSILFLALFFLPFIAVGAPKTFIQLGTGLYFPKYAIHVDKKNRKTSVWTQKEGTIVKISEYDSDQGKKEGDKHKSGDHRTPEGIYFIQNIKEGTELPFDLYGIRAFTLDYPNLFDKRQGKTGHGIWLHSIPDEKGLERGSRGCVVLRNESILDISKYVDLQQTAVIIEKSTSPMANDELTEERKNILTFLNTWKKAWTSKDIESYMQFYSKKHFSSDGKNWTSWKNHKENLNKHYSTIQVQLSRPVIFSHENRYIAQFLQNYRSDKNKDFGKKTLFFEKEGADFKIIAESWVPETSKDAQSYLEKETLTQL